VREIVLLERGPGWELYGKTGWANAPGSVIGWWVDWVQKDGRASAFALNLDMAQDSEGPKREALGRSCLQALGIL
jgi:beta-lactamase class D